MAYSELIKNFNRIRDYMREFYLFGFKSRTEYTKKSARSYDDERRRVESWLGDYMKFGRGADGKNVFLSIDSRLSRRNPLYSAWKSKSFTDGDITLHFVIFDILDTPDKSLNLKEITEKIDDRLSGFDMPREYDESTVRKKLKEYSEEGVILTEKRGKTIYYRRADSYGEINSDLLDYFSEVSPCGVVGSFLIDKQGGGDSKFAFKHHYITSTLDSEIVCSLLDGIREKRQLKLEIAQRRSDKRSELDVIPLRLMISVQGGRQYIMVYAPNFNRIQPCRIDNIISVKSGQVFEQYDELRSKLDCMQSHIWGVSSQGRSGARMDHIEFTIKYRPGEQYIPNRLLREKRCGTVEYIGKGLCRFSADVFDSSELIPWMRTFICRITDFNFSDKKLEKQFKRDLDKMYEMYVVEEDEQ